METQDKINATLAFLTVFAIALAVFGMQVQKSTLTGRAPTDVVISEIATFGDAVPFTLVGGTQTVVLTKNPAFSGTYSFNTNFLGSAGISSAIVNGQAVATLETSIIGHNGNLAGSYTYSFAPIAHIETPGKTAADAGLDPIASGFLIQAESFAQADTGIDYAPGAVDCTILIGMYSLSQLGGGIFDPVATCANNQALVMNSVFVGTLEAEFGSTTTFESMLI